MPMLGSISTAYNISSYGITSGVADPLAANLYAYWKFNGDATDAKGNLDLTAINSPTYPSSGLVFTQCTDMERDSTQYFDIGDAVNWSPQNVASSNDFTFAVWVNQESFSGVANYIAIGGTTVGGATGWFQINVATSPSEKVSGTVYGDTSTRILTATVALTTSNWHLIVLTHTDAVTTLYQDTETPITNSGAVGDVHDTAGGGLGVNDSSLTWDGLYGPAAYWAGRALTSDEVSDYYNSGAGYVITL